MPHYNSLDATSSKTDPYSFYEKPKKMFYLVYVMVYSFRAFYHVETIHRHVIFDFTNVKNVPSENHDKLPFVIISHSKIFKRFNSHSEILDRITMRSIKKHIIMT